MPAERVAMRRVREILRLTFASRMPGREIARHRAIARDGEGPHVLKIGIALRGRNPAVPNACDHNHVLGMESALAAISRDGGSKFKRV